MKLLIKYGNELIPVMEGDSIHIVDGPKTIEVNMSPRSGQYTHDLEIKIRSTDEVNREREEKRQAWEEQNITQSNIVEREVAGYCKLCRAKELELYDNLLGPGPEHTEAVRQAGCTHPANYSMRKP